MQYPLIIFQGGLDSPVNKVHLAIRSIILCISETTLVEGTVALLATFCVFMYEYQPGLVHFFALTKVHFTGTRWQKAAIFHHTLCKFTT